ncbi:MAG: hypothetical protein GEU75_08935 [Dehalococcoidia bacterium]|nr:hypothetical protein [Dehalococcoidia bacterium]
MQPDRLDEIRQGKRGLALVLYVDVPDDAWEDYADELPAVMVLGQALGTNVLELVKRGLDAGQAQGITDRAAESIRLLLATRPEDQAFLASMLEGISGRLTGSSSKA